MATITDTKAKNIKPTDPAIPHGGITGLALLPSSTRGRGKWVLRYVSPVTGKRRNAGLGTYPEIGIAEVGKLFVDTGIITLAAFISPNNEIREMAAGIIGKEDFLEIYVSTPLEECERRDVKGLYAKARRGEIKNFTGISAPFEAPAHPALSLDTSKLSLKESVDQLLDLILPKVIKK